MVSKIPKDGQKPNRSGRSNIWGGVKLPTDYLANRQDSVVALANAAGAVVETRHYSPYGTVTRRDAAGQGLGDELTAGPGFTGQWQDPELGLWDFRNRAYSPDLGRFLQRDPAGFADGLNPYRYCHNSPANFIDPDGRKVGAAGSYLYEKVWSPEEAQATFSSYDAAASVAGGAVSGLGQSVLNGMNGIENILIDNLNILARLDYSAPSKISPYYYAADFCSGQTFTAPQPEPLIPASDWSKGVLAYETDFDHALSSALVANGAITLASVYAPAALANARAGATVEAEGLAPESAAQKLLNPPIKVTEEGMQHVLDRHTVNDLAVYVSKSKFNPGENIESLIQQGTQQPMVPQPWNGNFARTYNLGREIGIDALSGGKPTSIMTVITRKDGSLVTAFPGAPGGR